MFNGHLFPGPQREGFRPLVQEHVQTVAGGAPGGCGQSQQAGLSGIIDRVKDDQIWMEEALVRDQGVFRMRGHPHGGAVDQELAFFQGFRKLRLVGLVC